MPKEEDMYAPYLLLGDEAYLKPNSRQNITDDKRIFNYRLFRTRHWIEYALWRCLKT